MRTPTLISRFNLESPMKGSASAGILRIFSTERIFAPITSAISALVIKSVESTIKKGSKFLIEIPMEIKEAKKERKI